jgi:fructose-bisphosphate aldolase class II
MKMLLNLSEILKPAIEHQFAVPAFNIGTTMILNGVMDVCEELHAPVILAIHPKEFHFQREGFVRMCVERAMKSPLPVCVHLDHSDWDTITEAVQAGFTSVMIDASSKPFEENVAITKKVVEFCHPLNVTVEGELGTIGTADIGEAGLADILYTRPEDAERFVRETGADALAIAIGTAHGLYPKGMAPKLRQDLLTEIRSRIPETPLVLHGGSGNADEEIAEAVRRGVTKINISSDIKDAFYQQLRITLRDDPAAREPFEFYVDSVKAMNKVIEEKVRLFNDNDKAQYYCPDCFL